IVRFHTITWPIILMALVLPLPGKVFGHGWLILEGGKMSKSKGNVIDPILLSQRYGVDAVRYYLLREIPFGADGVFTEEALWQRTNKDLANDFGNLLSRVLAMVERYFGGEIPAPESPGEDDRLLQETASSVVREFEELMDRLQFSSALTAVWRLVAHANRYVDQSAPWDLAKREDQRGRLGTVLYTLSEALRFISVMVGPFMPGTPPKMWAQMGIHGNSELQSWESLRTWGLLPPGTRVRRGDPIFPRLEWEDRTVEGGATAGVAAEGGARPAVNTSSGAPAASGVGHGAPGAGASGRELLSIDEFARLELKTALVLEASPVEGASKLLSVQLDAGGEERRVVAGIAGSYRPEDLVGKTVVLVANLKPAKIRGVVSEGMILAVGDENSISLLTVDRPSPPGGRVR
ncbi:MAG: methionine--tRNA ligase subunit beta, partial [Armatimonadetes bacterium]|nr:methionine--tRNA ligase subunit beta [Armatimonadota bacterium]